MLRRSPSRGQATAAADFTRKKTLLLAKLAAFSTVAASVCCHASILGAWVLDS